MLVSNSNPLEINLFLLKQTATMDVRKLSSLRLVPLAVLNKHSQRGDNDGCHKKIHNIVSCRGIMI
jgi:hypothetical protein